MIRSMPRRPTRRSHCAWPRGSVYSRLRCRTRPLRSTGTADSPNDEMLRAATDSRLLSAAWRITWRTACQTASGSISAVPVRRPTAGIPARPGRPANRLRQKPWPCSRLSRHRVPSKPWKILLILIQTPSGDGQAKGSGNHEDSSRLISGLIAAICGATCIGVSGPRTRRVAVRRSKTRSASAAGVSRQSARPACQAKFVDFSRALVFDAQMQDAVRQGLPAAL